MDPAKHRIRSIPRLGQLASNSVHASFLIKQGVRLTRSDADIIAEGLLPSEAIREFEGYVSEASFTSRELGQRYAVFMTKISASISVWRENVSQSHCQIKYLPKHMKLKMLFQSGLLGLRAWRRKRKSYRDTIKEFRNADSEIRDLRTEKDRDISSICTSIQQFENQYQRISRIASACAKQYRVILSIPLSPSEREQAEKELRVMFQRMVDTVSDETTERCHFLGLLRRALFSVLLSMRSSVFSASLNRILRNSIEETYVLYNCRYRFSSFAAAALICMLLPLAAATGARYFHGICR